ncbi:MAG: homoserine O-succinyltransferase, partial [Clostridium celatum]|nr:homoserine O-succinyltransferase [Clostridium celatum]
RLESKMFGIFKHVVNKKNAELMRGLDDIFYAPHSRHTEVKRNDIEKVKELDILSESDEAGIFIVANKDYRQVFITGHLEYERNTLAEEYFRDIDKGMKIDVPKNYFPDDDPNKEPIVNWRGSASVVFGNWLNYCVYQSTPYDLKNIHYNNK